MYFPTIIFVSFITAVLCSLQNPVQVGVLSTNSTKVYSITLSNDHKTVFSSEEANGLRIFNFTSFNNSYTESILSFTACK